MAWRNSDSTITMRVKPFIISRIAGRNDSAVKNSSVWIGTEKFAPPPLPPTSSGRAGPATAGEACAKAATGNASSVATPAALRSLFIARAPLRADHAAPAGDQLVHGRGVLRGGSGGGDVGRGIAGELGHALAGDAQHEPVALGADGDLDDGHALG